MALQKLFGPTSIVVLLITEIALIFTCYIVGVWFILESDLVVFLLYHWGLIRIAILVAAIITGLHFQDLYESIRVPSVTLLFQQVCLAVGLAFILQALLNYADSRLVFPRWVMLAGSGLALAAIVIWRIVYSRIMHVAAATRKVLFLGVTRLARELAEHFREQKELGISVAGFVGDSGSDEFCSPILGPVSEFGRIARQMKPDTIVVAQDEDELERNEAELLDLRFEGFDIADIGQMYERSLRRVCVARLRASSLIFSNALRPDPHVMLLKEIYTRLFAAFGLLLAAPVVIPVVLAIKLTSSGPVLYRQKRVGLHGRPFVLMKFRSMYTDAETHTGPVWAQKDDPRVTPVGRWIRRFRIDEIPQLVNALRGEMAIVGPRPERPEFVETLTAEIPFYRQRLVVKPGITGWAQISHRYGDTLEDTITKLEYDLFYVKSVTPMIDFYVMFHTAKVVLLGRGAQ